VHGRDRERAEGREGQVARGGQTLDLVSFAAAAVAPVTAPVAAPVTAPAAVPAAPTSFKLDVIGYFGNEGSTASSIFSVLTN
jgi:hypothetical protein